LAGLVSFEAARKELHDGKGNSDAQPTEAQPWRPSSTLGAQANTSGVEPVVVYGIAPNVPSGTHTVTLAVTADPNVSSLSFGADEQVEAIALKG
jgi:hypothetical protein